MPAAIKRIVMLRDLAVFREFTPAEDLPDFVKHNLIYGFNGSGKTTLSRVFRSLEAGALQPELPNGGSFQIELTDGRIIRSDGPLDALRSGILVFNVDFIEQNLQWKQGRANPVFYIGKTQADSAKKLEEAQSEIKKLEQERQLSDVTKQGSERVLTGHKRDAARLISEELNLGRKYNATNLEADYRGGRYDENYVLTEAQRHEIKAIILRDAPLPKINWNISVPPPISNLFVEVLSLMAMTLGTIALEELRKHDTMLNWVKQGLDYHTAHELETCLFCGNGVKPERLADLQLAIDDRYERLSREIGAATDRTTALNTAVGNIGAALPAINDLSEQLRFRYSAARDEVIASAADVARAVEAVLPLLQQKAASPNSAIDPGEVLEQTDAAALEARLNTSLNSLRLILEKHNELHDQFAQAQADARTRLKRHFLAEGQVRYDELAQAHAEAEEAARSLDERHATLLDGIERLKRAVRQHGPAAGVITKLVHCYLGHRELEIQTHDTGYRIMRRGAPVQGSLSEGEKTAIALSYFLSLLEAENRKVKDLIVVVDDPVSSLDTRTLNYAFNLIKSALGEASQLIIMTHNLHFMNEVKKWLKKKTEDKRTLLFLDAKGARNGTDRSTTIVTLPKLIREYDSEYHYLFALVRAFTQAPHDNTDYLYLMPNALRKVLEIFFAFRSPGSNGLADKVDAIAKGNNGIDPGRIRAIDRLVQVESHADSLDDIFTFSSMTIEETKDAAGALLEVMQGLDKEHYDRLCRICR